ncbi:MAG: hypothetical protein MZV63_51475 [Marinilabiliales bacterium]|nr:hypothetical protein [Marinilabiliales bacterium]
MKWASPSGSGSGHCSWLTTSDKISNMIFFAPFISLILLHFIIGEPVYYTTPIGLLIIIGSVLFQNRRQKT